MPCFIFIVVILPLLGVKMNVSPLTKIVSVLKTRWRHYAQVMAASSFAYAEPKSADVTNSVKSRKMLALRVREREGRG